MVAGKSGTATNTIASTSPAASDAATISPILPLAFGRESPGCPRLPCSSVSVIKTFAGPLR